MGRMPAADLVLSSTGLVIRIVYLDRPKDKPNDSNELPIAKKKHIHMI